MSIKVMAPYKRKKKFERIINTGHPSIKSINDNIHIHT